MSSVAATGAVKKTAGGAAEKKSADAHKKPFARFLPGSGVPVLSRHDARRRRASVRFMKAKKILGPQAADTKRFGYYWFIC